MKPGPVGILSDREYPASDRLIGHEPHGLNGTHETCGGVHIERELGSIVVETFDPCIVLRGSEIGEANDPIVDHSGQPADYVHTDGTVWTWRARRWRIVDGVHLRFYDLAAPEAD